MSETEYRLYPDGTVLHEDEYPEDCADFRSDDYQVISIPDEVLDYIVDSSS